MLLILNIMSVTYLLCKNYYVIHKTFIGEEVVTKEVVNLLWVVLLLVLFFIYKIYIYKTYKVSYNILSINKLYCNTEQTKLDKVLNLIEIILSTFIFCGLGMICVKILLIEMQLDLRGVIRILPLFFKDLYIQKVLTMEEKRVFLARLITTSLETELLKAEDVKTLDVSKILECLESKTYLDIKTKYGIYMIEYKKAKSSVHVHSYGYKLLTTLITSTVIAVTLALSYTASMALFPEETTLMLKTGLITTFWGKVMTYVTTLYTNTNNNVMTDTSCSNNREVIDLLLEKTNNKSDISTTVKIVNDVTNSNDSDLINIEIN